MFALFLAAVALYALTRKKVTLRLSPAVSWPIQARAALQTGKHYFFTLPDVNGNAQALQRAVSLAGFTDVLVFMPGSSLDTAPHPFPPDWGTSKSVRVTGRWAGKPGYSPFVFNVDGTANNTVWISTEDYVMSNVKAA